MSSKLSDIRRKSNFKMRELAIRAGVSASTISDIERYGYVPRHATQQKIANALKVEVLAIWPDKEGPIVSDGDSTPTGSCQETVE